MSGRTLSVAGMLAAVLGLLLLTGSSLLAAPEPYVVGAVFDITGPASPLGTPERDTARLVEEMVNRTGGINGHPLRLVIYDNGSEETKCVMAFKKLIEKDEVLAIVGPSQSGTTLAVVNIVEAAQVPLVSCAASIKIVSPVKKWVFKTPQNDNFAVQKLIEYFRTHRIKRIAFINVANAFGTSGLEQAQKLFPGYGMSIIATESFGPTDTDMTAQLTRIRAANPDAVVCWGTNPGPALVTRNMRQLGMTQPLFMSHGVANRKFIELAGDAADGVIFPAGRLLVVDSIPKTDPRYRVLARYSKLFQTKYGREADTFGGHAWDALHLVVAALKAVGPDRAKMRDYIEKTRGFVGTAGIFNFSPQDHNGLSKDAFVMVKISNGRWELMK